MHSSTVVGQIVVYNRNDNNYGLLFDDLKCRVTFWEHCHEPADGWTTLGEGEYDGGALDHYGIRRNGITALTFHGEPKGCVVRLYDSSSFNGESHEYRDTDAHWNQGECGNLPDGFSDRAESFRIEYQGDTDPDQAGAQIGVSDSPCMGNTCFGTICGTLVSANSAFFSDNKYVVNCDGVTGRYAYVLLPGNKRVLSFQEFEVFEYWGSAIAAACPAGYYQPSAGSAYCLACSSGKYQDLEGQAECKVCEPGKYCERGYFHPTWTDAISSTLTADEDGLLEKTSGGGSWSNAGAASVEELSRSSELQSVEWITMTSNKAYMIGLSNGDSSAHYNDIDFALYAVSNTRFEIYENGAWKGHKGYYSVGDKLEVRLQGDVVTYWCNDELRYTSTQTPTFPLRVDSSFHDHGHHCPRFLYFHPTWTDAISSTLTADEDGLLEKTSGGGSWSNAGAASVEELSRSSELQSVEWIAATSNKAYMIGLSNGDSSAHHNDIDFALYAVSNTRFEIFENDAWKGHKGYYSVGDKLEVRLQGDVVTYWWSGAYSTQQFTADAVPFSFRFRCAATNDDNVHVGLSEANTDESYASVQFAVECKGSTLRVVYSNAERSSVAGLDDQDDIAIYVTADNVVHLAVNGEQKYTWAESPNFPLVADVSAYKTGYALLGTVFGDGTYDACADDNELCSEWAAAGDCNSNPTYMLAD
eukprot:g2013.t1